MKIIRFFAMLSRMKYIHRWGLMRNTRPENLTEHTLEVAMLAHALCVIGNSRLGGSTDAGQVVLYALYHDCGEIVTGDLPTPVKYHSQALHQAYRQLEQQASDRLLALLPDDLRPAYQPYLAPCEDPKIRQLVKAADKLSALIKCIDERQGGNREFTRAETAILRQLEALALPEVAVFLEECLPAYSLTLDEL